MKTPSIRNILVPIDFSSMSIAAIETAERFAQTFGATVHLVHAHEFLYPAAFTAPASPMPPYPGFTYDEMAKRLAAQRLIEIAKRTGLSPATTHVLPGSPAFEVICRFAKDLPADFIVMSTHGQTGLKRVLLGSTAERIVQHSPCPVFVARQSGRSLKKRRTSSERSILVPVDFSHCSLAGLTYGIGLAKKTGARIVVLHVIAYRYTTNGWVTYELTEATKAAAKDAERQMKRFVGLAKFGGVPFKTEIVTGNTVDKICGYAQEHDVDLIVTSTHGRTGLKHVLMGSIAENVVRRARCSVVAVPSFPGMRTINVRRRGTCLQKSGEHRNGRRTRSLIEREKFTRKFRKLTAQPFPERRKTNRFRETHLRTAIDKQVLRS